MSLCVNYLYSARCIQHFPVLFIQSEVFAPTVECSLSAATLDHRDSFMSVMKYLKALLACPYNKEVCLYVWERWHKLSILNASIILAVITYDSISYISCLQNWFGLHIPYMCLLYVCRVYTSKNILHSVWPVKHAFDSENVYINQLNQSCVLKPHVLIWWSPRWQHHE